MSLIFTQVASYNFTRPNATPLDPLFWRTLNLPPPAEPLSIVSNQCVCLTSASNVNLGGAEFIGAALSNNQYVDFTVNACTATGFVGAGIRSNTASSVGYEVFITGPLGNSTAIELDALSASGTLASTTTPIHSGDVIRLAAFGTSLFVYVNGVQVLTAVNSEFTATGTTFLEMIDEVNQNDVKISNYAVGNVSGGYSIPDDRNYGNFPNNSRNIQGTSIYDVPSVFSLRYWFNALFNRTQPLPVDSRVSTPVDSRTSSISPQNSRTPPA